MCTLQSVLDVSKRQILETSPKKGKEKNKQTKENQKEKQGEVLRHWDLLQVETGVEDGGSSLTLGI